MLCSSVQCAFEVERSSGDSCGLCFSLFLTPVGGWFLSHDRLLVVCVPAWGRGRLRRLGGGRAICADVTLSNDPRPVSPGNVSVCLYQI